MEYDVSRMFRTMPVFRAQTVAKRHIKSVSIDQRFSAKLQNLCPVKLIAITSSVVTICMGK
jgi:hypothetical protein